MKKNYFLSFSGLLFLWVIIREQLPVTRPADTQSVVATISQQYLTQLASFATAVEKLDTEANRLTAHPKAVAALRKSFLHTRLQFKQVEFLVSYLDPEYVNDFINGAPLPKLERKSPSLSVLQPKGLQVLEELIFSDKPFDQKEELLLLTQSLNHHVSTLSQYQNQLQLTDRHIFEAVRGAFIRVMSLGMTGFDSPVALHSLPEALTVVQSTHQAMQAYYPVLEKQAPNLREQLERQFTLALAYLRKNQDFDSFDRLQFLRDHLNPLYKTTLEAHLALGIETKYETGASNLKHSVNYYADNLFASDFLDPLYYTQLRPEAYNPAVVDLGRTLFFDPILSSNNERSCASCHNPERAFTDGQAKSLAFDHQGTLDRNAPSLINAAYADRFFYDLRADVLENQVEHVLVDKKEFHTSYLQIFTKLAQSPEYVELFRKAFPEVPAAEPIMKHTLSSALSAYVVSLRSFNSPFDRYVRGETQVLDPEAKKGFNLFMGKAGCGTCHFAPVFNGSVPPHYQESESEVLGVPAMAKAKKPQIDADLGRYKGVLKEEADIYRHSFKTTTVRNVALTAPYMHNGVFETLEEVVEFYNKGGGIGLGLDVPNQTLPPDPLKLSKKEVKQVVAFMHALTDTSGLTTRPAKLPVFPDQNLNKRVIGGLY